MEALVYPTDQAISAYPPTLGTSTVDQRVTVPSSSSRPAATFEKDEKTGTLWRSFLWTSACEDSIGTDGTWRDRDGKVSAGKFNGEQYTHWFSKGKEVPMATLVAVHWIFNPLGHRYVQHIDGDWLNNRVENLKWSKRSQRKPRTPVVEAKAAKTATRKSDVRQGKTKAPEPEAVEQLTLESAHVAYFATSKDADDFYAYTAEAKIGSMRKPTECRLAYGFMWRKIPLADLGDAPVFKKLPPKTDPFFNKRIVEMDASGKETVHKSINAAAVSLSSERILKEETASNLKSLGAALKTAVSRKVQAYGSTWSVREPSSDQKTRRSRNKSRKRKNSAPSEHDPNTGKKPLTKKHKGV